MTSGRHKASGNREYTHLTFLFVPIQALTLVTWNNYAPYASARTATEPEQKQKFGAMQVYSLLPIADRHTRAELEIRMT